MGDRGLGGGERGRGGPGEGEKPLKSLSRRARRGSLAFGSPRSFGRFLALSPSPPVLRSDYTRPVQPPLLISRAIAAATARSFFSHSPPGRRRNSLETRFYFFTVPSPLIQPFRPFIIIRYANRQIRTAQPSVEGLIYKRPRHSCGRVRVFLRPSKKKKRIGRVYAGKM